MATVPEFNDERVLVVAPRGRNAELISTTLNHAGAKIVICDDVNELCAQMAHPTGAVILCEEALNRAALMHLMNTLAQQPPWSELPLLVLTGGGATTRESFQIAATLNPLANVTLMERPVRMLTLTTAVRAALRARRRQYEVRDLLAREQTAREVAEAASNAKDQFLATLSHELRTPLNPVLMTVTAMANDPRLPQELLEDVNIIKRNIALEARLIDDLLDLTRIARGKLELHQEAVDIHAVIQYATTSCCQSDIRTKPLEMRLDLQAMRHGVLGDAARLTQVFWNLIKNAVKFTPPHGSITLRTRDGPHGLVKISISDTGIGIAPDALGRIFDAFEQGGRGITRQYGGLGLGLAICKALVELHGGTITAASGGKNQGSTFEITLSTAGRAVDGVVESQPPSRSNAVSGARILVVEDHDATAFVMERLLRSLSHRVTLASDVQNAKRLLETSRFDLLISDLGLPDGSGLEVIAHLREKHNIPAIAVSGYGMEEDVREALAAGFDDHLVKPIDFRMLQSAIERLLTNRAQQRSANLSRSR